jgi:hypothetical protein
MRAQPTNQSRPYHILWADNLKGDQMEEETKPAQPIIGEYQGKPIIRIPTVDNPNPDTTWHWLSFGKNKATAIVKFYDAIKKFAEE